VDPTPTSCRLGEELLKKAISLRPRGLKVRMEGKKTYRHD
jgi:hypothetical protein